MAYVDIDKIRETFARCFTIHKERSEKDQFDGLFAIDSTGTISSKLKSSIELTSAPNRMLPLKFDKFIGNFYISNQRLTSLEGCPQEIYGGFFCNYNPLKTLDYAPKIVDETCELMGCQLESCYGLPKNCGNYYIGNNNIRSLEGIDSNKSGILISAFENMLEDLRGCPFSTTILDISNQKGTLKSLKGIPQHINHLTISLPAPLLGLLDTNIRNFKRTNFHNSKLKNTGPGLEFWPPVNEKSNEIQTLRSLLQKHKDSDDDLAAVSLAFDLKNSKLNMYAKI